MRAMLLLAIMANSAEALGATGDAGGADGFPHHLTLAQALERFHRVGFDSLLAEASVQGAEADVKTAGAVNNPIVSAYLLQAFGYNPSPPCPGCDGTGFGVSFQDSAALMDILSGKRGLRVDVARAALRASRLSREDAQRTLDALLKEQYLAVSVDTMLLGFTTSVRESLAHTFGLFNLRYGQGDISEADLVRMEVQSLQSEQDVDEAQEQLNEDKVLLAFLLGNRGATPEFDVDTGWLQEPLPMAEESLEIPDLLTYALVHRPDLRAQAAQKERAQSSITLGRRLRVPDVAVQVAYSQQGTGNMAINPPTLQVGFSLTLPAFYQYQGEIQHATADLRAQSLGLDKLTAEVANDIGAAHQSLKTSRSRLSRMQQHLLGRAGRVLELVRLQYNKGAGSLIELLDAQRTYTSVTRDWFSNLNDYWTARFELEQAMGLQVQP